MHKVNKVTSCTCYTVPCFFVTCPVPNTAYDRMVVDNPKLDKHIADNCLLLLLVLRMDVLYESLGQVNDLLMKWHCMCTPLSKH